MSDRDPNELGALWEKTSAKGTYFTGKIGEQPVVVFRNDRKQAGSNAPDWRVLKPTKKEDRPSRAAAEAEDDNGPDF